MRNSIYCWKAYMIIGKKFNEYIKFIKFIMFKGS